MTPFLVLRTATLTTNLGNILVSGSGVPTGPGFRYAWRNGPAFYQIITKRDTSNDKIVWRLSPDLLKRSSDVTPEDDVPQIWIEQFPKAFNSVTQLAPSSPPS